MCCWFVFLLSVQRALGSDLPVGDEWVRGWGSCKTHHPAKNGSGKPPPVPCFLSDCSFWVRRGAFYSESSLPINSPADRSRLILAQPQMSPIQFIQFTGSAEKELSWALHDMYILSGYHLQVIQRPHKNSRQREREEIFQLISSLPSRFCPYFLCSNFWKIISTCCFSFFPPGHF